MPEAVFNRHAGGVPGARSRGRGGDAPASAGRTFPRGFAQSSQRAVKLLRGEGPHSGRRFRIIELWASVRTGVPPP